MVGLENLWAGVAPSQEIFFKTMFSFGSTSTGSTHAAALITAMDRVLAAAHNHPEEDTKRSADDGGPAPYRGHQSPQSYPASIDHVKEGKASFLNKVAKIHYDDPVSLSRCPSFFSFDINRTLSPIWDEISRTAQEVKDPASVQDKAVSTGLTQPAAPMMDRVLCDAAHHRPEEDRKRSADGGPASQSTDWLLQYLDPSPQSFPASLVIDNANDDEAGRQNKRAKISYGGPIVLSRCSSDSSVDLINALSSIWDELNRNAPAVKAPVKFGLPKGKDKGTDEWRERTNSYAATHTKFTKAIYDSVTEDLGHDREYLVMCEQDDIDNNRIAGHWYPAEENVIKEKTKQRFYDQRKIEREKIRRMQEFSTAPSESNEEQDGSGKMPMSSPAETLRILQEFLSAFRARVEPQQDGLAAQHPEDDDVLLDNLQWTNGFVLSLMASANGASVNGEDDA